jgi:3-hydroxyacyl-[acyl-carrier-protein] dehydratase
MWIDKFVEFNSGRNAVAIKNVTLAEEHLHDHFPGFPVMPESLMIEAMAQTAGILVGQVRNFQEKVILAKIKKAVFFDCVKPGDTIRLDAKIESVVREAASTSGWITLVRHELPKQAPREDPDDTRKLIAEIDLMFSHIDKNLAGKEFPEENFVFSGSTFELFLRDLASDSKHGSEQR